MHLVGILFPHINEDARSKSHQTSVITDQIQVNVDSGESNRLNQFTAKYVTKRHNTNFIAAILFLEHQWTALTHKGAKEHGKRMNYGSILDRADAIFLFFKTSRLGLMPKQPPIHWVTGVNIHQGGQSGRMVMLKTNFHV